MKLHAKYCSADCRKAAGRHRQRQQRLGGKKSSLTPALKNFRKLAQYADIEDPAVFVREVMQDAIREQVTQHVQDNLLGAGEALTGMLPKVLAGLAVDLESKDFVIRQRAQAAVMKYAFEFRDRAGKDQDLGTIQVVHNVALPNTPLGQTIEAEIIEAVEEREQMQIEGFEEGWPKCSMCHEVKHPDAIKSYNAAPMCSSCVLATNYRRNRHDPAGYLDRDPEFGKKVGGE